MPISDKQKKILAFPYTKKYRALICDGAVRSGKTSIMTVAFVDWAMREFDNTNFAICGKTVGSAIKNIVVPYMALSYAKKWYHISFTRSDNKLVVRRGSRVNTFYIYGGKDESSYMLIQGITLGGVLLDEVALMTRSFVEQALARCSVDGARFWFNCNPENPNHWFYREWIKPENHKEKKVLHLHFLMIDNPSLSQETLERYYSIYSGVFYDRYVLGKWVRAEGVIYRPFADDPVRYFIGGAPSMDGKPSPGGFPALMEINIGMDFGGTHSKHSLVATGVTPNYKKLIALRSERMDAEGTTPADVDKFAIDFAGKIIRQFGRCDYLHWDSAEQVLGRGVAEAIEKAYPSVNVRPCYKAEINDRIALVTRLLGLDMFGYTEHCETLKQALMDAVWNEKKEDTRLDDGSTDVDTLDALEYSFCRCMHRFIF